MSKGKLVAMVGLPRSGKTTIVNEHYRPLGYVVVSPDDLRMQLTGQRFYGPAEPIVWAVVQTMVDYLLGHSYDVVVDATNTTKARRSMWSVRHARFHAVTTSADVCYERALAEGDSEILPIIRKMAEQWEYLDPSEVIKP